MSGKLRARLPQKLAHSGAFISPAQLKQIRQRKTAPRCTQYCEPRSAIGKIRQCRPQRIQIANQRTI
jgi:hypothetical protein